MTSSSSVSSSSIMQLHLQKAIEEVSNRQQVQECLSDMITNVEWADQCNLQAKVHQSEQALEQALSQQTTVALETSLVQREKLETQHELADSLVRELYKVSQELGELYQLREDHKELNSNYDSLVAKLLQAEERIQFMQEGGQNGGGGGVSGENDNENSRDQEPKDLETTGEVSSSPKEAVKEPVKEQIHQQEGPSAVALAEVDKTPTMTPTPIPTVATIPETKPSASVQLVPPMELPPSVDAAVSATAMTATTAAIESSVDTTAASMEPANSVLPAVTPSTTTAENLVNEPAINTTAETVPIVPDTEATSPGQTESQPATASPDEPPNTDHSQEPPATPSVVLVEQDGTEEEPPRLETLEQPILMNIFGFLDALDILNTAQVNISMYSRVDNLFGLGDAPAGDSSTIDTSDSMTGPPAPAPVPQPSLPPEPQPTTVILPPPAAKPTMAVVPSQPQAAVRPLSAQSTPKQGPVPVTTATSGATSTTTSSAQGFDRSLFGFLQPRKSPTSPNTGSTGSGTASGNPVLNRKNSRSEPAPMNAAMANSMASKLTDAELNAIIHMTDRLRTKESQLEQLRTERERLLAQLDGTDAVKQFLVAKVRSMEESLRLTEENEGKVAQQIASDQEVIAFLDSRVQELEEALASSQTRIADLEKQWKVYQAQAEQKSNVLTDMLRFERERVQETQNEFRATKKLLVKEVKACRAQIMALTAENRAVQQENDTLKRALLGGGSSGGTTSSSSNSNSYSLRV